MNFLKGFRNWLKSLSVKTTVVLTGIGITLFIAMQQALIGSLSSGMASSDIYAMAFTLWFSVTIVTLTFAMLILFIGYIVHKIKNKLKSKSHKQKKEKQ